MSIHQSVLNRTSLGLVAVMVLSMTIGSGWTATAQTVTATSWLWPTAIIGPGILRIGARVGWQ